MVFDNWKKSIILAHLHHCNVFVKQVEEILGRTQVHVLDLVLVEVD